MTACSFDIGGFISVFPLHVNHKQGRIVLPNIHNADYQIN